MTQAQIQQIADEYAEWFAPEKDYTEFPGLRITDMCIARDDMKRCLEFLCENYAIVEKSIVEEMRELSDSAKYDKDYMTSQNARAEYDLLEALFPRTFNPDEK